MAKHQAKIDVDLMFRAFSDRTRLRILYVLGLGELCVGDLVEILQLPQPRVSRHLAYLRRSGLVCDRRVGPWKHYALAPAETDFQQNLLQCVSKCFRDVPELQADAKRAGKLEQVGGCCERRA